MGRVGGCDRVFVGESGTVRGKRLDRTSRRWSASKLIAAGVLVMDAAAVVAVLGICVLAVTRQFSGALPYLVTLIGALQAVTAVVLTAYFQKAKAENTRGGIVYDAALGSNRDIDA